MIAPAIRGGICHAAGRYARANNPYMGSLYNPAEPASYIFNLDANNLYGFAQSQPLPVGEMKWIPEGRLRELEKIFQADGSNEYRDGDPNTKTYFILDVDIEYPAEIHDRDDDFPMAPEMMMVDAKLHNETQLKLITRYYPNVKPQAIESRKLLCTLNGKETLRRLLRKSILLHEPRNETQKSTYINYNNI